MSWSDIIFCGREVESFTGHASPGSVLPERLTPLMFSRPHVCARMSASGLLVKVERLLDGVAWDPERVV